MCVSGNNGDRKCMSVINDGRAYMLGVSGSRTCLESTLASHVNDGCTCTGDQLSMHVRDQRWPHMYIRDQLWPQMYFWDQWWPHIRFGD